MRLTIAAVWIAASGLLACGESQAGSDYKGEPLMTLRGVVKSPDALVTSELVPALMFSPIYENMAQMNNPEGVPYKYMMYYTKGEVEGEFPSAFTLRLYEPPDKHVLVEMVEGEPAFARGGIVAVSPRHPKWLRTQARGGPTKDGGFELGEDICSDSGQCLAVDLSVSCAPDDGENHDVNFNDPYPCGSTFPGEYPWVIHGVAERHGIIYFAAAVPAGSVLSDMFAGGEAIDAGYHVLRDRDLEHTLSAEEYAEASKCSALSAREATAAVNRIHGTDYKITEDGIEAGFQGYPDQFRTWDEYSMRSLIEHDCALRDELVDASEDPIALTFTEAPPFNAIW